MLGYIVVDIVTGGHSNDLAFEGIGSLLDPLRAGVLTVLLDESLELLGSTGLLAYSDYFAGLNLVRGPACARLWRSIRGTDARGHHR